MDFSELKKTLAEEIETTKNELKMSDEEMEAEAVSFLKTRIERANNDCYGTVHFKDLAKFAKEVNLSLVELERAIEEEHIHFIFAPDIYDVGREYAEMFLDDSFVYDCDFLEFDYTKLGKTVVRNLGKIFKSGVYKEGVGIIVLDADEISDVYQRIDEAKLAMERTGIFFC